jgi:hypothetical protein
VSIYDNQGADRWREGVKVMRRDGRYVQASREDAEESIEVGYACEHTPLKGKRRCLGCGRTRNEIVLDGDE